MSPEEMAILLARLQRVIDDAQSLQVDIEQKRLERRSVDRGIPQALGRRNSTKLP